MASSTIYLSALRVTLSFVYPIHALFVAHVCLVIVVFDHEYDGYILLYLYPQIRSVTASFWLFGDLVQYVHD
jgi:hypothetical protein